ncbi:MAG: hypothetical protein EA341_08960 [Mongoliibacter sp.]|uniref:hypothetical protein n=1 Tax=Mongoliibacter sp. TaxID=2022438 RepID=UPI0012F3DD40|nr:hypothetical protein [Mongoliibacter sp.]TVP49642.1 MAG: hypothetical protein EA341_08960 [Mongoliibacter sp.]
MKYTVLTILGLLFAFQTFAQDCPRKLVYGNPEWPNMIEVSNNDLTRVFYFEKALLIKNGEFISLELPTFFEENEFGENPIFLNVSGFVDKDLKSPEGNHDIRNVDFTSKSIDCMEIEKDFGRSGMRYDRSISIKKAIESFYEVELYLNAKADGLTTIRGKLGEALYREVEKEEIEQVAYKTSNGEIQGHVIFSHTYDQETNRQAGLHVEFDDEEVNRFSLTDFDGKPGVSRLGTMGNRFVVFNKVSDSAIDFDIYTFDFEDIKAVQSKTFFDFAIGEILMNEFKPVSKINVQGPLREIGEGFDRVSYLGAYRIDPGLALREGYHYEPYEGFKEEVYPSAMEVYKARKIPEVSLKHQSGEFSFVEKQGDDQIFTAILPNGEEEEKLDCDRIFGAAQKVVEEKYGPDGPSRDQETEMMRIYAEMAAKEGLDIGDVSDLDADQIQDKLMAIAAQKCGGGRKRFSEPVELTAKLDSKGKLVSREYFLQIPQAKMVLNRNGEILEFIAENEEQGRQSLKTQQFNSLPDMAMFLQLVGGIQFDLGKVYQLDFYDYKLTQSTSASSGFGGGTQVIQKRNVYPVKAEFLLEAVEVVAVEGKEAYKIALQHKDFGDGHMLLNFMLSPSPGHGPYRQGGYLFVDKNTGQLLKAVNRDGETAFGS